jgi:hypothetical protein
MLAEFSSLLHEMSDSLRGRHDIPDSHPLDLSIAEGEIIVLVTGLASPGKTRLVAALERRLRPAGIAIHASTSSPSTVRGLHVHAETDLDSLIEGHLVSRAPLPKADVIVAVDWEPVDRSVTRVIEQLVAHGIATSETGG